MSQLCRQSALVLVLLAGCGGSSSTPKTPGGDPQGGDGSASAEAAGTTGVKDLSWGATAEQIQAAYPTATAKPEGGLWATGNPDGYEGITSFTMGAKGLEQVDIEWTAGFPTMQDCLIEWAKVRSAYDTKYAVKSQSDNGAAYWNTSTVNVTLSCNPNDSGAGVMSASFVQPGADEPTGD